MHGYQARAIFWWWVQSCNWIWEWLLEFTPTTTSVATVEHFWWHHNVIPKSTECCPIKQRFGTCLLKWHICRKTLLKQSMFQNIAEKRCLNASISSRSSPKNLQIHVTFANTEFYMHSQKNLSSNSFDPLHPTSDLEQEGQAHCLKEKCKPPPKDPAPKWQAGGTQDCGSEVWPA